MGGGSSLRQTESSTPSRSRSDLPVKRSTGRGQRQYTSPVSLRVVDGSSIVALGLLLVTGCARGPETGFVPQESSTGYLETSVAGSSRIYSFRSDPETEFIRKESHGGMVTGRGHTVVFNDGRLVMTYTDRAGSPKQRFEKQLTEQDMRDLLTTIVESGLMDHDHSKAKLATFRNPDPSLRGGCSDCPTVVMTIRLAEDHCPGRGPKAPITASAVYSSFVPEYSEAPELVALDRISKYLSHFRRPGRVPRPD